MNRDPNTKPPADQCPQSFCFHWAERGVRIDTSGGTYDTFEEAVAAAQTLVVEPRCGCIFGTCTRATPSGDRDWYEPNERRLKNAGLPWFYFISGSQNVAAEFRDQYISESTALWGRVLKK